MTNRGMAVLGLRLFALYLFVSAFKALPELFLLLSAPVEDGRYLYLIVAAHLGPVLLAVLLWTQVGRCVDIMLPARRLAGPAEPPVPADWQSALLSAAGLVVLAAALPMLVEAAMVAHLQSQELVALTIEQRARLTALALQIVLGLALFLRGGVLGGLVRGLRQAGLRRDLPRVSST